MSSATQTALALNYGACAGSCTVREGRKFARRICQAIVLLPLFTLILQPEYAQGLGDPETKSILYRATIGPLRLIDALLLGLIAAHVVVWASSRSRRVGMPRSISIPGIGFLASIMLAAIYGALHGGVNLFFDWRALALGVGIYVVVAIWVRTQDDVRSATLLFAFFMTVRIALLYWQFVRGGGDTIVGVRIPVFDGPTLSAIVFTGLLSLCMSDATTERLQKLLWTGLSAASYLLVLLCFRRTFWAELGIGTLILIVMLKRGRGRTLVLATLMIATVTGVLGPTFFQRVQSLDFSSGESEFSQGNPDHVGEVLDAWDQVQKQPLLGIGLGRSFQTLRVQTWKEESVMVHNAPLHVWMKYGLMGLACYVWFHIAVFRWLWRTQKQSSIEKMQFHRVGVMRRRAASSLAVACVITSAALAYLAAQFVVTLGFAPWPYSSLQSTTLIAFVLAMAMAGTPPCKFQLFR